MWLDRVKQEYGDDLEINWRHFSLEQINSKEGPDGRSGSRWTRARRGRFWRRWRARRRSGRGTRRRSTASTWALLTARHAGGRIPLNQDEPLVALAEEAGLDVERFKADLNDPALVEAVAADHEAATTREMGVFGTPTFLFENGHTAYMKTFIPPEDEAVEVFDSFVSLFGGRTYVGEVKSPQPPWPKGALD